MAFRRQLSGAQPAAACAGVAVHDDRPMPRLWAELVVMHDDRPTHTRDAHGAESPLPSRIVEVAAWFHRIRSVKSRA